MAFTKSGDTPLAISQRFGVSVKRLLKYNEITRATTFKANQRVYLQPKRTKFRGKQKYHVVKAGETMYDIGQLYGIKTAKLYKKNRMDNHKQPVVGAKIALRRKVKSTPRLQSNRPAPKPVAKPKMAKPVKKTLPMTKNKPTVNKPKKSKTPAKPKVVHVVKKGETLYRISKQHNVSVEQIKQFNRLGSNTLEIGQKLIIRY